ncbi:UPF0435 protein [Insulibacter thermoxylanivorax]|uniref:UPF0435 protein n=1 Tax=Insulibacter thermoxylanivorax TaxID=2749268 RepID=A0A916VF43_9BACL|nr:DUF1128 domain-containing protein [Insulibacter thermoxylanivorax]GFR37912.1 UPF0435 protein [Insulibacter thermoxylanivorax]
MDLNQRSLENVQYMIDRMITKLKMATAIGMNAESFDLDRYEDIRDIYELVMSKDHFSINEMEAIVSELGQLRKA